MNTKALTWVVAMLIVIIVCKADSYAQGLSQPIGASAGASGTAAGDDKWRNQFKSGTEPLGKSTPRVRSNKGKMEYTLHKAKAPTPEQEQIYEGITKAMDEAIAFYNRYTSLKKHVNVTYSPGTPTADGNINGSLRLGGQRNTRTCLHEMGHCVGVGTHRNWSKLMVNGRWKGKHANKLLQELTKHPEAELHGDHMHFWPYGLNFDQEAKSEEDMIRHARIVEAIVKDLEETK